MKTAPAALKVSEKDVLGQVVGLFRFCGFRVFHDNATNAPRRCPKCGQFINLPRNEPGWLDVLGLKPPRLIVAEIKVPGGSVTREQEGWLDDWRRVPCAETYVWMWSPELMQTIGEILMADERPAA